MRRSFVRRRDGYTRARAGRVDEVVIELTEVADVGPLCARYSPALVAHESAHGPVQHPGGRDITVDARKRHIGAAQKNASTGEPPTSHLP